MTLDTVLGGRPPAGAARLAMRDRDGSPSVEDATAPWTAVVGPVVTGVEALAPALHALIDTLRTAERLGHRGWLDHPNELAVERLMLIDDELLGVVVHHELGPLLADTRMGDELIETLDVYFEAGENMREAARRLHLANRTVAYRLERIETPARRPARRDPSRAARGRVDGASTVERRRRGAYSTVNDAGGAAPSADWTTYAPGSSSPRSMSVAL